MTALSRVQALVPWAALAGVAWLCHRTHRDGETLRDVRSIVVCNAADLRAIRDTLKEHADA